MVRYRSYLKQNSRFYHIKIVEDFLNLLLAR